MANCVTLGPIRYRIKWHHVVHLRGPRDITYLETPRDDSCTRCAPQCAGGLKTNVPTSVLDMALQKF